MSARSVATEAEHIAKLIKPGMSILDVGCGPGSITIGIAELANPGRVVGVDMDTEQFDLARSLAQERGLDNVELREGSIYELPFDDESFDVVTENGVIMHLSEPESAIAEMKRVLKSGGYIGLRDLYITGRMINSQVPCPIQGGLSRIHSVYVQTQREIGADWDAGIKHRGRLKAAEFAEVESGVSHLMFGNDGRWQFVAENKLLTAGLFDKIHQRAIEMKLLSVHEVSEYERWFDNLSSDPTAIEVRPWFHATGRKL